MKAVNLKQYGDKYRGAYGDIVHYSFRGWALADALSGWDKMTDSELVFGVIENEELLSVLIINDFMSVLHGKAVRCGGVGAVSTLGTKRKLGATAFNLKKSLEYMYENGFVVAPLAPFKYEFYRKYGWELGYSAYGFSFPMDKLAGFSGLGGFTLVKSFEEYAVLRDIYERHIFSGTGAIVRSTENWQKKFGNPVEIGDTSIAVYENGSNEKTAYIVFRIIGDTFNVAELIYESIGDLKAIFGFIYSHSAQCSKVSIDNVSRPDDIVDIMPSKRIDIFYGQGMMNRVVNAKRALELYPYTSDGALKIAVRDDVLSDNNSTFSVCVRNGHAESVVRCEDSADISLDIREFSQLMTGFRSIDDIVRVGRAEITSPEKKNYLRFKQPCMLYDHF